MSFDWLRNPSRLDMNAARMCWLPARWALTRSTTSAVGDGKSDNLLVEETAVLQRAGRVGGVAGDDAVTGPAGGLIQPFRGAAGGCVEQQQGDPGVGGGALGGLQQRPA